MTGRSLLLVNCLRHVGRQSVCLMVVFLIMYPSLSGAQESIDNEMNGLSFRFGRYMPKMAMSLSSRITWTCAGMREVYDIGETPKGHVPHTTSFGVYMVTRRSDWSTAMLGYEYQPGSVVEYEVTKGDLAGFTFPWPYTLHMFSASWRERAASTTGGLDFFLGLGVRLILIEYPDRKWIPGVVVENLPSGKRDRGGTVFPLAGVEFAIVKNLHVSVEYQYHFGRTQKKKHSEGASFEGCSGSYAGGWWLDVTGPQVVGALNFYYW